jgi:NADPH:quinone reductase-like Zn-dependent oxidoreductase
MAGGAMRQIFEAMLFGGWMSRSGDKKMGNVQATIKKDDLLLLKELLEAGKIVSVIDKRFPFSETPEALRYLGSGHARGKVVITMGQGGSA